MGREAPGSDWTGPSAEPASVTFLPWFQNPSGHGFLTKEELLRRCAQKTPRVSTEMGKGGAEWLLMRPRVHQRLLFLGASSGLGPRELDVW